MILLGVHLGLHLRLTFIEVSWVSYSAFGHRSNTGAGDGSGVTAPEARAIYA